MLYLGSPSFDVDPPLLLEGAADGDLFGAAIADIGDVNGDGFGDFAVGAPGAASGIGRVYVFLGGATPAGTAALEIGGSALGGLFGSAITGAGDLNRDGFSDYAVGAPGIESSRGGVFVFHGAAVPSGTAQLYIRYGTAGPYGQHPRFGAALAGGGDITGDGRPDLIVGVPGLASERGSVFAFPNVNGTIATPGLELVGLSAHDHFGSSLRMETILGRGTEDLIVGSPGVNEGRGKVSLFTAAGGLSLQQDVVLSGSSPDDAFGWSVGAVPPHQGIRQQILIGAPFSDLGGENAGAAFSYIWSAPAAVEQLPVFVEADGVPLKPNTYTSTHPRLIFRLQGAAQLDSATAEVEVDGAKVNGIRRSMQPAPTPSGAGGVALSHGLEVSTGELTEGTHVLRARISDAARSAVGVTEITFLAATRLRIQEAVLLPNPSTGPIHLRFTLTRPAAYELRIFDVQGRLLLTRQTTVGIPASNDLIVPEEGSSPRLASGVYFYRLEARYQGQRASAKGRMVLLR